MKYIYKFLIILIVAFISSSIYRYGENFLSTGTGSGSGLDNANYVYIISKLFNKSLSFDVIGQKSFVYVDQDIPIFPDDCNTENEDLMPQKWIIKNNPIRNNNICISNYSKDGAKYYLTANNNGTVSMSLFGGGTNQDWILIKKETDPNNTNLYYDTTTDKYNVEVEQYYIKSVLFGTYLASNNSGYVKENTGNVILVNSNMDKETLWTFAKC